MLRGSDTGTTPRDADGGQDLVRHPLLERLGVGLARAEDEGVQAGFVDGPRVRAAGATVTINAGRADLLLRVSIVVTPFSSSSRAAVTLWITATDRGRY